MVRMNSRKLQAMATKRLVLDTASRLTGERGFENVTIQDICSEAGVAVGTFYHYFSSKEEIILAWYGLSDEYFESTVRPKLDAMQSDVFSKVGIFAQEQIGFGMQYGIENIRQLYRAQILYHAPDFYSHSRGLVATMVNLIHSGQQNGELQSAVAPEQIADEVLRIIRGVILDWIWGGTQTPQTVACEMTQRYLRSYAAC